jgi:AraC-like DNA-binding protein
MLAHPTHMTTKIAEIAYTAGFADVSHFNRVFRRRYGMAPSDVRIETMRRGLEGR